MADALGPLALSGTLEERTWRITCFCENGTDYSLEAHREKLLVDASGVTLATLAKNFGVVTRSLSQVASDPDAIQFLTLAKTLCDKWAAQDAANLPQL